MGSLTCAPTRPPGKLRSISDPQQGPPVGEVAQVRSDGFKKDLRKVALFGGLPRAAQDAGADHRHSFDGARWGQRPVTALSGWCAAAPSSSRSCAPEARALLAS